MNCMTGVFLSAVSLSRHLLVRHCPVAGEILCSFGGSIVRWHRSLTEKSATCVLLPISHYFPGGTLLEPVLVDIAKGSSTFSLDVKIDRVHG
jgi:hypothetical protein